MSCHLYMFTNVLDVQAGLLAQQDSFAPFIWVAVQSILNVIGDLVLIMYFKQGLVGAAWATVLSQLVGTIGLVWMLRFRGQVRLLCSLCNLYSNWVMCLAQANALC